MKKILVTFTKFDENCKEAIALLEAKGFTLLCSQDERRIRYSTDELRALMQDIDAVIAGLDKWDETVFECSTKLRVIARFGVGIDNVDTEAAKKKMIYVLRAKGGNARSVAELALAHMLNLLRRIHSLNGALQKGEWPRSIGTELTGKTIGLVGYGDTAQNLARILSGFDVCILACRQSNAAPNHLLPNIEMVQLEELLSKSDIVSLHIPFAPEYYHLFDEKMLSKFKRGAYLINTARGALIDEAALIDAINAGQIAGAALDVYQNEPLDSDSILLGYERIVCTPHIASETYEACKRNAMMCAQGIIDVFEGRTPENWVNPW